MKTKLLSKEHLGEIKGFSNSKINSNKIAGKDEINLLFLDKSYVSAVQKKEDKVNNLFQNKKFLLSLFFICLTSSFYCLQIEYGLSKSLFILTCFILSFKALFWSFQELQNNLIKTKGQKKNYY